jgi:hypothetical protein
MKGRNIYVLWLFTQTEEEESADTDFDNQELRKSVSKMQTIIRNGCVEKESD